MPQPTEEAPVAHIQNDEAFVTAYDTRTGKKLPNKIPRAHLKIFPNLSAIPKARASEKPKPVETPKIPDYISSDSKKEG